MSLIDFQKNDVLVQIKEDNKWAKMLDSPIVGATYRLPLNDFWKKFHKRISDLYKETGSQTACLVTKTILWEYKNEWIESPFALIPLELHIDKNSNEIIFQLEEEDAFINPFIEKQFQELFGFEESDFEEEIFQKKIHLNPKVKEIHSTQLIGQFHYHRYLFLKEIEEIEASHQSALIQQFFGEDSPQKTTKIALSEGRLLPVDPIQKRVLAQVGNESLVIQGPPGTGKSQVLINVLGKALASEGNFACVSEKKSALDVIHKKLSNVQLNPFAVYLDDQIHLNAVYQQFKEVWKLLENQPVSKGEYASITPLLKSRFQLLVNRIQTNDLSSGISFWKLKELQTKISSDIQPDSVHSISIAEWENLQPELQQLSSIPFQLWAFFDRKFWKKNWWKSLSEWMDQWDAFQAVFPLQTFEDIQLLNQWGVLLQLKKSDGFDSFERIVTTKTNWAKFQKLKKHFFQLQLEIQEIQEKTTSWNFVPTPSQIDDWKNLQAKTFGKKKVEKILQQEISAGISLATVQQISEIYHAVQEKKKACLSECADFNIFHPEQDFITIEWLKKNLNSVDDTAWKSFESLTVSQKEFLNKNLDEILSFSREIPLKHPAGTTIPSILSLVKAHFSSLKKSAPIVTQLPSSVYYWMQRKNSFSDVETQIVSNEWHQFQQLFPEMASLDMAKIQLLMKEILQSEREDEKQFQQQIFNHRKELFDQLNHLIITSPRKLNEEEKEFRKALKKGKSILVKELNKTRQHLPLRELWKSEAKHWLNVLTPIWLMTPTQVAKHFPMEKDLFQIALIDEASQLPISHILGTLQRSKQVVIAGDSQQMAPSNFFQSEKETDILSFAQYYLPNVQLKYHYRSQHPALIQFSNRYFYKNELEVFPYFDATNQHPIQWIYVECGNYDERQNKEEAKVVAQHIQQELNKKSQLGIVAFSETQLQAIWQALDGISRERLTLRLEKNQAFFKSLDKVQGDECDTLIISFGYGKNSEGDFHLHLGPILQKGEEKRLNVLFSRAKKNIIFISSVKSEDFPISENLSVELLRNYLQSLEREETFETAKAPELKNWLNTLQDVDEIITKYQTYSERGWNFKN